MKRHILLLIVLIAVAIGIFKTSMDQKIAKKKEDKIIKEVGSLKIPEREIKIEEP